MLELMLSNGDAADSEIAVSTDETGKIRRAKPEICK